MCLSNGIWELSAADIVHSVAGYRRPRWVFSESRQFLAIDDCIRQWLPGT
jgi:hypothetical protein